MIDSDNESAPVRGQALCTLSSLQNRVASHYLGTPLKFYALLASMRLNMDVREYLDEMMIEERHERLMLASLLGEVRYPGASRYLLQLLDDKDEEVVRQSIRSSGVQLDTPLAEVLLKRLHGDQYAALVVNSLGQGDDQIVQTVQKRYDEFPFQKKPLLLKICGAIGTTQAQDFLFGILDDKGSQIEHYHMAIQALVKPAYSQDDVNRLISREVERATRILTALASTQHGLLTRALQYDLLRLKDRIFKILSFSYDAQLMKDAHIHIQRSEQEDRAKAIELLDVTISKSLKALVFPLLEPSSIEAMLSSMQIDAVEDVSVFVQSHQSDFYQWTIRCAKYLQNQGESMYSLIEKVTILRSVSIFSKTPEAVLSELAPILEHGTVKAGDVLFEENSLGHRVYIIIEGKVRVHQGDVIQRYLANREIVGELALLDPAPRSATVTAEEDTSYFTLDGSELAELMQVQPEITQGIIHVLVNRLRHKEDASD